eukprot:TRINITY_DN74969_c0_g1_i1.p1 TRINITY_DN74969_c0_g1~~TRINITY_DN74969_c0_g1_i1.p1  ORF type:complete len:106 (+),score=13.50 TRINITY_DN74969_c0_g1_i1:287-604(+)
MERDYSTVVLIDQEGFHVKSRAVFRVLPHMGFPYSFLAKVFLCVPRCVPDFCYDVFARHRGQFWRGVRRITGLGETKLLQYKDRIFGVDSSVDRATEQKWGLSEE